MLAAGWLVDAFGRAQKGDKRAIWEAGKCPDTIPGSVTRA
jgi:hypothetical protein